MAKATRLLASIGLLVVACGSPPTTPAPPTSAPASIGPSIALSSPSAIAATKSPTESGTPVESAAPVSIDPATFVATVTNPWFPLTPGTKLTYEGIKDGEDAVDIFEVTDQTKVVDGVTCVVIHDSLTLGGTLHERTEDWYVQDLDGNVWYFGEATAELDDAGKVVSTDGSWTAGEDGATPGIYMPGDPQVGQSMQQEFYPGQAEDHFVVLLTSGSVKVPAGTYKDALLTAEWTPLEPEVLGEKFYGKGVGLVKEFDVVGGQETLALTKIDGP
jgi:hypothetical protein